MIPYPPIGPDLLHIGPVRVRWYGMMYVLGFLAGRWILRRLCRQRFLRMPQDLVDDFLIALFFGMLVGARLLYMLVYYDPGEVGWQWYTPFAVWEGGLAFHGGLLGMLAAIAWFGWRHQIPFWNLADSLALAAPVGIGLGRIGNFINSELWGRETSVPWAMSFPIRDMDGITTAWTTPRHPSQLYEALGEGLLLLAFAWFVKRRAGCQGIVAGWWLVAYGAIRFFVEFFREKDEQMAYYFGWMTMGQILCAVMIALGAAVLAVNLRRNAPIRLPDA